MGDETWRSLAERTGNRIRLLQADLADADAEGRRAVIADEIRAALEKVIPQEREMFLEAIEARFPAWESELMGQVQQAAPAASVSATDMAEFNDPGFLIRQLQQLAPKMSADQRLRAAMQLEKAGILTGGAAGVGAEAMGRLRAALQSAPDARVDLDRLVSVMSVAIEKMVNLDDIASKNWAQLSQSGRHRGRSGLAKLIGQYVTGDAQVGSLQVTEELETFRRLAASLIVALSHTGQAAYEQMKKLHPETIQTAAAAEKGLLLGNEVKCWRKYRELADAIDPAAVEAEVLRVLAGFVSDLMSRQSR
ncbi:MAG: hypothetical protein DYG94_10625 [Leptolyngbya sp. PLA3]|nr:MAG: hypothetical protein EDM82_09190 [Cyanobacteria bacterium CYA]MCE7969186.1 hypothetical protein [Leptolyngbya sp. PL-A3]